MRTRAKSIVTAFVLLSLVSGAIGCRSNGSGPWYNPKSYSWHNPFKEGGEAPPYRPESSTAQNPKPSLDAQPNVYAPPGGYANPSSESDFFAGSQQTQAIVQTQYGNTPSEANRLAATTYSPADAMAGSTLPATTPEAYRPYSPGDAAATGNYQQTRYQQTFDQQNPAAAVPAGAYPGAYPATPATSDPMPSYANPVGTQPAAAQPMTNTYGVPATQQPSYGAPAATTTLPYGAPVTTTTTPYTATPSSYPANGGF